MTSKQIEQHIDNLSRTTMENPLLYCVGTFWEIALQLAKFNEREEARLTPAGPQR